MQPGAPILHDEPEYVNFADSDPKRNLAADIRIDIGDVEQGFAEADHIFEDEYSVPKVQQAHIEPHVVVTYWDEDDRLVIRTSTQVPFHVRRILAPVLGLPVKRIRVIKPRIGGGFGGKQEVLIEDVAAHLTIATGRPVIYEYTPRGGVHRRPLAPPDAHPHEDRRQEGRHHHRQRHVRPERHRRLRLPRPDRHRQHRAQSPWRSTWATALTASNQHPLLRRYRLHQHPACRRLPRLRRPAGLLAGGAPHGEDRARPGA